MRKATSQQARLECIDYAEDAGLYDIPDHTAMPPVQAEDEDGSLQQGTQLVILVVT